MKITYEVKVEPEDTPVRGNVMASGDEAIDREAEEWVFSQLKADNIAAWCCVLVRASCTLDGEHFEGMASLGCCSYESEAELKRDMLEHYDLKGEALAALKASLAEAIMRGAIARDALDKLNGEKPAAKKKGA